MREKSTGKSAQAQAPRRDRMVPLSSLVRATVPNFEQMSPEELRQYLEGQRVVQVIGIRQKYKWSWSAGAEYLYRELIRALQLEHHEDELVALARSKPGRKQNWFLYARINELKKAGNTVRQIQSCLAADGENLSIEAIEAYLKTRRKSPKL